MSKKVSEMEFLPTEAEEQKRLFRWAAFKAVEFPQLALLFHIPNGGSRHKAEAAHLREQGVKAGVPDLFLPVAAGRYHGLFIELKRQKHGKISAAQLDWQKRLLRQGYLSVVRRGWEEAAKTIEAYLDGVGKEAN